MKKAISEIDADDKFCIQENDGIALCVCKHKPCKEIKRLQKENLEYIKLYNAEVKKNQQLEDKLKNLQA